MCHLLNNKRNYFKDTQKVNTIKLFFLKKILYNTETSIKIRQITSDSCENNKNTVQ